MKKEVLKFIKKHKLIAIIRANNKENILKTCDTLINAGVKLIEITMTVPEAKQIIKELSTVNEILVGAGTVVDASSADLCIESGAKFIVSPIFDEEIVNVCLEKDIVVSQSAGTSTEVYKAYKSGVDFIKIFPADCMGGVKFIKAMLGPFPYINFMPSGGVDKENIRDYLKLGATALGVGGKIASFDDIESGDFQKIRENAESFLQVLS